MFMEKGELIEKIKFIREKNLSPQERDIRSGTTRITLIHDTGYNLKDVKDKEKWRAIDDLVNLHKKPIVNSVVCIDKDFIYPYKFMKRQMEWKKHPHHKYCEDMTFPLWAWTSVEDLWNNLTCTNHFINDDRLVIVFQKSIRHVFFSEYVHWHTVLNAGWPNPYTVMYDSDFVEFCNEFYCQNREEVNEVYNPIYWDMSSILQATVWDIKRTDIVTMGVFNCTTGYRDMSGNISDMSCYLNKFILNNYKKLSYDEEGYRND